MKLFKQWISTSRLHMTIEQVTPIKCKPLNLFRECSASRAQLEDFSCKHRSKKMAL